MPTISDMLASAMETIRARIMETREAGPQWYDVAEARARELDRKVLQAHFDVWLYHAMSPKAFREWIVSDMATGLRAAGVTVPDRIH